MTAPASKTPHAKWLDYEQSKTNANAPPKDLLEHISKLLDPHCKPSNSDLESLASETHPIIASNTSSSSSTTTASEEEEEPIWHLWTLIFDAASLLTYSHPQLISFILAIQHSNNTSLSSLPNFGATWRDEHDKLSGATNVFEEERFVNLVGFSAGLLDATAAAAAAEGGEAPKPLIDVVFPFFAMRDALEREEKPGVLAIRAAAAWVVAGAARMVYETRNEDVDELWQRGIGVKTPLWEEECRKSGTEANKGFSRERWAFWKKRFGEVGDGDDEVKVVVGQALAKMEDVEKVKE